MDQWLPGISAQCGWWWEREGHVAIKYQHEGSL